MLKTPDLSSSNKIRQIDLNRQVGTTSTGAEIKASFESILAEQLTSTKQLKFSAHAEDRLRTRNIALSKEDIASLEKATDLVQLKGGRQSLILMSGNAFVVSVVNRTVVTAVDEASLRENVFTNIDSAVLV